MVTEKLSADKSGLERGAEILKNGGIVAIPTETVYGLAASAMNSEAIKKVFEAKGRPQDNPLIVHICDMQMLEKITKDIPATALKCAEKFWPGPFTMVLPSDGSVAKEVSAGLSTVAVRMPSNKAALEIIALSQLPLAAPSANISGSPSPTTAIHVQNDLDGKIDAIVFGNDCEVGVESTVISFAVNPPRILRPGAVTAEQLKEIIPDLEIDKAVFSAPERDEKVASPGMKYKHYAPKTEAYLVVGTNEKFAEFVNKRNDGLAVCFKEEADIIKVPKLIYGECADENTLAHEVFSILREIDDCTENKAYIHAPSKSGVGLAVYNRLIRACGFKEIEL